jgi:hypothetical protein
VSAPLGFRAKSVYRQLYVCCAAWYSEKAQGVRAYTAFLRAVEIVLLTSHVTWRVLAGLEVYKSLSTLKFCSLLYTLLYALFEMITIKINDSVLLFSSQEECWNEGCLPCTLGSPK